MKSSIDRPVVLCVQPRCRAVTANWANLPRLRFTMLLIVADTTDHRNVLEPPENSMECALRVFIGPLPLGGGMRGWRGPCDWSTRTS